MKNPTIDYYNKNALAFCEGTLSADMHTLYKPFLSCIPSHGKVLDCGCGSGRDSKFFQEQGYAVDALDASAELCRIAEQYTGIKVRNISFDQIAFKNEYDGIWACASLLHIEREQLPDIFRKLHDALIDSGILYASFKYGSYSGMRNDRYFTDMNEPLLSELLHKAGCFKIHQLWITTDVRADRSNEKWLNVLLEKF